MRGVNLNVFDFDYDLEWAALFMNAGEKIYGRYGSRDADSASGRLSLAGFRYAMERALAAHRRETPQPEPRTPPRTVEQFAAARRVKDHACIHCHQVLDFEHERLSQLGQWRREDLWLYPLPENIGLTLDIDQGNRILRVDADSAAAASGLRAGDVLRQVNRQPVASIADLQYALQRAPAKGQIELAWERDGKAHATPLMLRDDWRVSDISWRASVRKIGASPPVYGEDLTPAEKKTLGLSAKHLAFRQGPFISKAARQAGIQQNDIIVGIDDKDLQMTASQFAVYVRLNYQTGERAKFNVLRDGRRLGVTLKLPASPAY